jgi:hypothetical protein
MQRLALTVVAEQKRLVPRKTGNLGRSIHIGTISASQATVVADANYAAYTEFGTRPHFIVPVNKKALRFAPAGSGRLSGSPRSGGRVIFAKRVQHPGTTGIHWAQRGAQAAVGKLKLADVIISQWNEAA